MASMMNNIKGSLPSCWDARWLYGARHACPHSDWDKLAEITGIRLGRATTCASILSAWNNADIERPKDPIVIPVGTDLMAG